MIYLLDTDTLTHLHHGHPNVGRRLGELSVDDAFATTIITKIEILRGRFDQLLKAATGAALREAQDRLIASEELLAELAIFQIDESAASHFDRLGKARGLKRIGRSDLLIASVALARGATLVTRNLRHFRPIPGLRLENWVD